MSTAEIATTVPAVIAAEAETSNAVKKATFVSKFNPDFTSVLDNLRKMEESYMASKKAVLLSLKSLQTNVVKMEREYNRIAAKSARRVRQADAAQSFVGVNLPKRVSADMRKFLEDNKAGLPEKLQGAVREFMSLNEVNRCVLALANAAGVIDDNKYNFKKDGANAAFVSALRRLLVDLCPAGYYPNGPLSFDAVTETRRMSGFLNHLLNRDAESDAYVAARITEKRETMASEKAAAGEEDAAAAVAPAAASASEVPAPAAATAAPVEAVAASAEEPNQKKRKLVRKPATATA